MYVIHDNFLWHPDIDVTFSSEHHFANFRQLLNPDPYTFWETTGDTLETVTLNCSLTGTRKPYIVCIKNHNLTPDAIITLQGDSDISFSSPVEQSIVLNDNFYDYRINPETFNTLFLKFDDIKNAGLTDKAFIRCKIVDSSNPDTVLRIGVLFIASLVPLALYRGVVNEIDDGFVQRFFNDSTVFYSVGHQLHLKIRKVGSILVGKIETVGIDSRLAVRRIFKRIGVSKPCFINVSEYSEELEYATQTYYGYFSKVPSMKELEYYIKNDLTIESVISFDFEFKEIV